MSSLSKPVFVPGMVVEVVLEGGRSGKRFIGRRYTLVEGREVDGLWCWRAPEAWSREMSASGSLAWDLHFQELRLRYVSDQNIPLAGGWERCLWKPHLDVVIDPRNPENLVNVWEPVNGGSFGDVSRFATARSSLPPLSLPPAPKVDPTTGSGG